MKANTLLKVVSIIMIIVAVLGIVLTLVVSIRGGAVIGAMLESVGTGLAIGGGISLLLASGSVLHLVAGILGVQGKYKGCKVMGIIILVFAIISALTGISIYDNAGSIVLNVVTSLLLPVLYVWGAFKGLDE